jgi:hypothetical protein
MENRRRICDINIFMLMTLFIGGCATTVIPPKNPADPVPVYLTDYGRHSSVLLPVAGGGFDEYAFGDWDFFALGHTKWWIAIRALIHSPQATLARRHIEPGSDEAIQKQLGDCKRLMRFDAAKMNVKNLAADLDERFNEESPAIFSDYCKMYCVRDDECYWIFHNCNNVTAGWLKSLDCKIRGSAIYSNFHFKK